MVRAPLNLAIPLPLMLICVACPEPAYDDDAADGSCARVDLWGSFALWTDGVEGGFEGIYHDGSSPLMQEELLVEGACVLHGFDPMPHCEPGCDPPQVCGAGSQCLDWPPTLEAGTLQVAGTSPPLELEPGWDNAYYTDAPIADLVLPGTEYTLDAGGSADLDPFTLTALGVGAFSDATGSATARRGETLSLSWTPGTTDARVVFEVGADHHAGTNAYVRCEVPDATGTVQVPAALIDALLDASSGTLVTTLGSASLYRHNGTTTRTNKACAAFVTYTKWRVEVTVE